MWGSNHKESWAPRNWCFPIVVLEKTLESPLDSKEIKPVNPKGNPPWIFIGSLSSNTLATWCKELTHWKRPSCWERLKVGEEGDNRGWDGWMASPTQWTWVWASSGTWWRSGKPGVLQFMGSQRVGHDWATKLNWYIYAHTYLYTYIIHKYTAHTSVCVCVYVYIYPFPIYITYCYTT